METKQNDYIPIAEYATRRGVSVSSVYKRLGGTLKKYCLEIDGKKFLSAQVLVEEGITPPVEAQEKQGAEETPAIQKDANQEETTGTEQRRGFLGRLFFRKKN